MLSPVPSDPPPLSPGRSSCGSDTGAVLIRSTRQMAAEAPQHVQITVRKLREPQQSRRKHGTNPEEGDPERAAGDPPPGPELQTSCYQPGGRGVVLGALRQRCVGTKKREVSVQLLEPRRTLNPPFHQSAEDAAGVQGGASSGLEDVSRTAVAAAAAAVAAAAPLFKAQSDIEAQMSRLSESVQKLLETNREADGWRWGLSQQTLHHLETLQSQQLQLQSQLMESAIKIVTGHGSMTSDSKAAAKIRYQKPGRPASTAAITQMDAVTMETGPRGSRPGQTRDNLCVQAPLAECLHLQSLANDTQEAVRRASDMLKQMESLKTEIKMLLTVKRRSSGVYEDLSSIQQQEQTPQFSFPAPVQSEIPNKHLEPQQNKSKPKQAWFYLSSAEQSQSRPNDLQQNDSQNTSHIQHNKQHEKLGQQLQSQLNPPSSRDLQPVPTPSQAGPSLTHPSFTQESRGLSNQRSHPGLVQRKPGSHSVLEEAGQVLRQARRRKKVLEENLEALMKAKNGEILHCQLEALAANRDLTEDVRIKKTVDAWISSLTRDTQVQDQPPPHQGETRPGEANQHRAANAAKFRPRPSGRGKTPTVPRGTSNRPVMGRGSRGQPAGHRTLQEAEPNGVSGNLMGIQQEDVGGELYLTRLYGKLPHEGLRRTLKRSPYPRFSSPASPLGRKHRPRLVESIRGVRVKSCKTQTSFSPLHSLSLEPPVDYTGSSTGATAIPLRPPRIHSSSRREHHQEAPPRIHSSFMSGHGQEVLPSALPASGAERNDSTDYQQKQQPITEKPSSSPLCIIKTAAAEPHEDHEENFPGNNFLSVSDLNQEENSEVGEEAVVLEGRLSPSPVRYHSPAFPPRAPSPRRVEKGAPAVTGGPRRDVLEDRLVEWVEQQLMSRMIADMYPRPPPDPAQNDSTDQSELEEQSLTSDIVKAAGGGGLQLFVDSNMSVDSALIRQLVNEVLSETVAQMLNGTDVAPEPEVEAAESQRNEETEQQPAPLVPTPVPTPPPSGPQPSRESPPAATPPPSTPSSPVILESAEPVPTADPVATPTATPEPRSPEESPPASLQAPPPKLPLDEDGPEEELESQKQPLVASMEEEEPPACRPATAQSEAEPSPALPPSLSETSSSSSSSSSSSVTAETEAALKHISEGELLISANQLAPLTEEEGLCSFSSSLREVEDMTLDSSTVEQVGGRDLLLTLLTKVDQGGQRPDPEGSWGREEMEDEVSLGEVRDYGHLRPQNRTRTVGLLDQTSACGQNSPPAEDEQQEKLNTGGAMKGGVHPSTFRPQEDRDQEEMRSTESSSDDVF